MTGLIALAANGGNVDLGLVVELLVAAGLMTAIAETVRWFLGGRGRARVDNAKIVQGMAIDLVEPLHSELEGVRKKVRQIDADMEALLGWAIVAKAILDGNHLGYPAVPDVLVKRMDGV